LANEVMTLSQRVAPDFAQQASRNADNKGQTLSVLATFPKRVTRKRRLRRCIIGIPLIELIKIGGGTRLANNFVWGLLR